MVAAIVQARLGSSRLPGKCLLPLGTSTVLDWVVERAGVSELVDEVIVATTTEAVDDELAAHVERRGTRCVRGSTDDVLARFVDVLGVTDAERVIRITADCPFVEPTLIAEAVRLGTDVDYVATGLDGRFPRGLDLEVVDRTALLVADAESTDPVEREHVTPFIVRRPERFRHRALPAPEWARRLDLRFTIDEDADYRAATAIVDGIGADAGSLTGPGLVRFLDDHPEVVELNRSVSHREVR